MTKAEITRRKKKARLMRDFKERINDYRRARRDVALAGVRSEVVSDFQRSALTASSVDVAELAERIFGRGRS